MGRPLLGSELLHFPHTKNAPLSESRPLKKCKWRHFEDQKYPLRHRGSFTLHFAGLILQAPIFWRFFFGQEELEDLLFGTSMFEGQEKRTQLPKNQRVVVCCFTQNFRSPSNSSTCPSSLSHKKRHTTKRHPFLKGFSRFHGNKMASPKQFCLINFTFPTLFVEPGLTVLHPKHLKFFLLTAVAAEWCGFKFDQNPCAGWDAKRNFMDPDFGTKIC